VTSQTQNFTVSNAGAGKTGTGYASVGGSGAGAFQVVTNGCASGLSGPGSCRGSVTFATATPGTYNALLTVWFGDPSGGPYVRAELTGTAG
jgi:hypothetical protein